MYLHDALSGGIRQATSIELAEIVNRRRLYESKDKRPVRFAQVSACAYKYPDIFYVNKTSGRTTIGLIEWERKGRSCK